MFEYIEAFYNRQRRHSTLGMVSPAEYEQTQTTSYIQENQTTNYLNNPVSSEPGQVHRGGLGFRFHGIPALLRGAATACPAAVAFKGPQGRVRGR